MKAWASAIHHHCCLGEKFSMQLLGFFGFCFYDFFFFSRRISFSLCWCQCVSCLPLSQCLTLTHFECSALSWCPPVIHSSTSLPRSPLECLFWLFIYTQLVLLWGGDYLSEGSLALSHFLLSCGISKSSTSLLAWELWLVCEFPVASETKSHSCFC